MDNTPQPYPLKARRGRKHATSFRLTATGNKSRLYDTICIQCGAQFQGTYNAKACSDDCRDALRIKTCAEKAAAFMNAPKNWTPEQWAEAKAAFDQHCDHLRAQGINPTREYPAPSSWRAWALEWLSVRTMPPDAPAFEPVPGYGRQSPTEWAIYTE